MVEKMRESHRQLSELQCYHKYLMVLRCHLSEERKHFTHASFLKLRDRNDHFLTEPVLVLNQTHFYNFEMHSSVKFAHTGSGVAGEEKQLRHFHVRCTHFN